jgi:hypothetical protein
LIIKKIHGGTEVWCIQHRSLIINATYWQNIEDGY